MSTWRVYFQSPSCPIPLVVLGKVCEQICIGGRYHLARGKGAPLPAERLRMGQRSPYCLLLPLKTPKPHQQTMKPTSTSASKDPMKYKCAEPRAETPSKVPLPSTPGTGTDGTRRTAPSESIDGNKDVPMEASTEQPTPPREETVLPQVP
uniref:AlNc14C1112G12783 protein n=1 Tax=Albugo laibachii Nc14 TaxID=890382 RepID=F0X2J0_9STRA|nr:AlNc14C1112G12783 [Albugo laibachii Nc14]|eukprot:CCA28093.1 AlNc14C1112G12783 [Albugo laibachii Nc14]